jgi:hypothetical protein
MREVAGRLARRLDGTDACLLASGGTTYFVHFSVQDILEAFYLYHYHHTLTLPPEKTVSEPEKHLETALK